MYQYEIPSHWLFYIRGQSWNFGATGDIALTNVWGQNGSDNRSYYYVTGVIVCPCNPAPSDRIDVGIYEGPGGTGEIISPPQPWGGPVGTITGITAATSAVVTLSNATTVNPFISGDYITFASVSGMTEINGLVGLVTATGGASGSWTATVDIDSSGFTAYSSGGTATAPRMSTVTDKCFSPYLSQDVCPNLAGGRATNLKQLQVAQYSGTCYARVTQTYTNTIAADIYVLGHNISRPY